MSMKFCFLANIFKGFKKKFFQHIHGGDAKQLFYGFCQKIVRCEIYCFFAHKTTFDNGSNRNKIIY